MDGTDALVARYDDAIFFLPPGLRDRARSVQRCNRAAAEEFHLRVGGPVSLLLPEGEMSLGGAAVSRRDLDAMLEIATGASAHSSAEQIRAGYVTVRGGYRIGICGSAIVRSGSIWGFSAISSVTLRISREIKGTAKSVLAEMTRGEKFGSTLIISPPGGGKTTLLRDMVRLVSDGDAEQGRRPMRVALADERSEVAAIAGGVPQMDVGRMTDVLDSCPKAQAVMLLLRAMNPEVVALDEVTAPEDVEAIARARNCGIKLIATAHADGLSDLERRPFYRGLVGNGIFEYIVLINRRGRERKYEVLKGAGV